MNLKQQALSGFKWNFLQQLCVQAINFVVQIILARLLMPEMFGLVAMIVIFISIGQALVDSGMTSSLIREKAPTQLDYSTVFMTNSLMSGFVYFMVYIAAPYVARFYNQEVLTEILRVFALTFVIRSLAAVHVAKLTKEMNFKLQMKLQLPSTMIAGVVGVTLAINEFGVWSLVWLNLAQAISFTVLHWICISWRPSLLFDWGAFKYHFNFGYKLTLASLLDIAFNDSYRIIIGKFFSPLSVGLFHQAETLRLFPVQQISSVLGKVTYPLFSKIDSDTALKLAFQVSVKLVLLASIPLMLTLILVAEELFGVLLGEKWMAAVPYFQILAVASIVRPVSVYNLNILKVKGRSDTLLKLELFKKVIGIVFIASGFQFGVMGLVISLTAYSLVSFLLNMIFSGALIGYPIYEQLKDIVPLVTIGGGTFFSLELLKPYVYGVLNSDILVILFLSVLFLLFYCFLIFIFERELIKTLKTIYN